MHKIIISSKLKHNIHNFFKIDCLIRKKNNKRKKNKKKGKNIKINTNLDKITWKILKEQPKFI